MGLLKDKLLNQTWRKDEFLIATDLNLIPIARLNEVFATDLIYWANPIPDEVMRETLENSLCFGLYKLHDPKDASTTDGDLIGFARCITDFTTFVYLTDVYIDPDLQGKSLGAWLVSCVQQSIESMPFLRRSMLFTSDWKRSVPFYEKNMDMNVIECKRNADGTGVGLAIMQRLGPAFPAALLSKSEDAV